MKHKKERSFDAEIKEAINDTRHRLFFAQQKLSLASDPRLIDEAIFEWKSLEARYGYLLSIKKNGGWE